MSPGVPRGPATAIAIYAMARSQNTDGICMFRWAMRKVHTKDYVESLGQSRLNQNRDYIIGEYTGSNCSSETLKCVQSVSERVKARQSASGASGASGVAGAPGASGA